LCLDAQTDTNAFPLWFVDRHFQSTITESGVSSETQHQADLTNIIADTIIDQFATFSSSLRIASRQSTLSTSNAEACATALTDISSVMGVENIFRTASGGTVDCATNSVLVGTQQGSSMGLQQLSSSPTTEVGLGRGTSMSFGKSGTQYVLPLFVRLGSRTGASVTSLGAAIPASGIASTIDTIFGGKQGTFAVLDDDGQVLLHSNQTALGLDIDVDDPKKIHSVNALTQEQLGLARTSAVQLSVGTGSERSIVTSQQFSLFNRTVTLLRSVPSVESGISAQAERRRLVLIMTAVCGMLALVLATVLLRWRKDSDERVAAATATNEKEFHASVMLAKDRELFERALDVAEDNISITNSDGLTTYLNKSFSRITGFSKKEALWKKAGTLWGKQMPTEYYKQMWQRIAVEKKSFVGEITNKRKDGTSYRASIAITPVVDETNEVTHYIAVERPLDPIPEQDTTPKTPSPKKK
jgi:PAS domain S-box-containing protein